MEAIKLICLVEMVVIIAASLMVVIQRRNYENAMKELASDFSERIQEYQRKLTVLCTEPESDDASEICLHIRLNKAAEKMAENNSEGNESININ